LPNGKRYSQAKKRPKKKKWGRRKEGERPPTIGGWDLKPEASARERGGGEVDKRWDLKRRLTEGKYWSREEGRHIIKILRGKALTVFQDRGYKKKRKMRRSKKRRKGKKQKKNERRDELPATRKQGKGKASA